MADIMAELLSDTTPDSLPRKMAEKGAELYRLTMGVCERFALPHTSICVGIWSRGSDSGARRRRVGSGLSWSGRVGRWELKTAELPAGPLCPWGLAGVQLDERPEHLRHLKVKGQDLYDVTCFRWCHKNPAYNFTETLSQVWRLKRYKSGACWFQSEDGDVCERCQQRLSSSLDVLITPSQKIFCVGCAASLYDLRPKEKPASISRRIAWGMI